MRSSYGQELPRAAPASSYAPAPANAKEIPYDYVARFILDGATGRRHQDVINISIEGPFVATAIAYGFLPKARPIPDPILIDGSIPNSGPVTLLAQPLVNAPITFPATLSELLGELATRGLTAVFGSSLTFDTAQARASIAALVDRLTSPPLPPRDIDFKYSIVDSGTGRELQNLPILNLAGLGSADGQRPFRSFPKPMSFLPRSTIRIEVEEVSDNALLLGAELQLVLHGYKLLGAGT
jgi:hypothetical protein